MNNNVVRTFGTFNVKCCLLALFLIMPVPLHVPVICLDDALALLCFPNSGIEPRLLWERVEKLVPRPGSGSSSGSSNSGSQPGSHPGSQSGSGERFRVRCRVPFLSLFPVNHTGLQ